MNPSEMQFTDQGAQNVKDFGSFNVEMMPDGKTALRQKNSPEILPRDIPMGGEEIMRRNKMKGNK